MMAFKGNDRDRVIETKTRVEAIKVRVRALQVSLADAKALAEGQWPRQAGTWGAYQRKKREWQEAVNELGAAKLELTKLSGTSGGDPRWALLRKAWRVLNELEERGVVLGDRGEALMEDIEFHVPLAKLHEEEDDDDGR